jgi:hypothetical protein
MGMDMTFKTIEDYERAALQPKRVGTWHDRKMQNFSKRDRELTSRENCLSDTWRYREFT